MGKGCPPSSPILPFTSKVTSQASSNPFWDSPSRRNKMHLLSGESSPACKGKRESKFFGGRRTLDVKEKPAKPFNPSQTPNRFVKGGNEEGKRKEEEGRSKSKKEGRKGKKEKERKRKRIEVLLHFLHFQKYQMGCKREYPRGNKPYGREVELSARESLLMI